MAGFGIKTEFKLIGLLATVTLPAQPAFFFLWPLADFVVIGLISVTLVFFGAFCATTLYPLALSWREQRKQRAAIDAVQSFASLNAVLRTTGHKGFTAFLNFAAAEF